MGIGIKDWHNKSAVEQAFTLGHFKKYPPGDPFLHYMMAQICVMICDAMGAKKSVSAEKKKPDPKEYQITDFAPWLKGSQFDASASWTEEDELQLAGNRILDILHARRMEKQHATTTQS